MRPVVSVMYGVGNAVWKEIGDLKMLILPAATRAVQIKSQKGGGL